MNSVRLFFVWAFVYLSEQRLLSMVVQVIYCMRTSSRIGRGGWNPAHVLITKPLSLVVSTQRKRYLSLICTVAPCALWAAQLWTTLSVFNSKSEFSLSFLERLGQSAFTKLFLQVLCQPSKPRLTPFTAKISLTLLWFVSPAGFGMTTPATVEGKIFLIFYGLLGCSSTILFFNLFLERLITVIACIMKSCHQRQLRRRGASPQQSLNNPGKGEVDRSAGWKPSVYYVMLILCMASLLISCCASAMYTSVEGWSYFDALYFCFVAFSTIGFGDLVSSQNARYASQGLYRFANFVFILMGVCCIYSLFNVISILIKQSMNWILRKMDGGCCQQCQRRLLQSRRNVVMPGTVQNRCNISIETDGVRESDTDGRRLSGEMISMKDFLAANKVSLAILQKQLSETANGCPHQTSTLSLDDEFSGGVGAFAIMNNRLAETSGDR